ncbi:MULTISPECIES: UDP-glucose--hexose-1-phosphate uridylyltransferase [Francisella]|uniref:Galactose-1-phosphate uridylyltransferase n=1 Tax=Francisella opportunistica TaxID=2016517 RepID=A0A345JRK4_9GAMM|nr:MULTISPECIES: UDP-glucose--hexose-1-phosphate uridylyltransferase [Francisella]APC91683.1 Galactose-1-phosphate uridylyltransferase [Francisella sp. MA067296]AXH29950.1 UDP-glucose--hexose-1-phosphate uridylyltransferase [Francisella opportunistica]AXH31596.1 galactose-1-phosphate uridylyltransferase [Francisella opportunistica]AXH33244.1 galactose-1-phosphate uridylyltransferase [Francisella opportunistica]
MNISATISQLKFSHRRKNILTNEWVLVSPHRLSRPWQGQSEDTQKNTLPEYDDKCYLCPTNTRANEEVNPDFKETFVFENDFSALSKEKIDKNLEINDDLFQLSGATGIAKVICFSAKHNLTMASMQQDDITKVVDLWATEVAELSKKYQWVQVFENKGSIMGCSNPHPHGQIWACDFLPTEAQKEHLTQLEYFEKNRSNMLLDYVNREINEKDRIVFQNDDWLIVVPFWATWPYETLLLPKFKCSHLNHLNNQQRKTLANALKVLLVKYDKLFDTSFPYSMGWHGSINATECNYWQLHAHFYPPLLRSATVKKFMVGFEMLGESQRDITPELAAQLLREL